MLVTIKSFFMFFTKLFNLANLFVDSSANYVKEHQETSKELEDIVPLRKLERLIEKHSEVAESDLNEDTKKMYLLKIEQAIEELS